MISKQGPSRIHTPTICADPGCGRKARPGGIYCGRCDRVVEDVCADDADLELGVVLLRERLQPRYQQKKVTRRIKRHGSAPPCVVCGRKAVPGRLYCSKSCRSEGHSIELDGVTGTVLEHAKRRGLALSTVYRRMQLGRTPIEALTEPVDEVMRSRRLGLASG